MPYAEIQAADQPASKNKLKIWQRKHYNNIETVSLLKFIKITFSSKKKKELILGTGAATAVVGGKLGR